MWIKVLSRSHIKPAVQSCRRFIRLSNLDQIMGASHSSMLLFFRNAAMPTSELQASLERLLVEFHPLTGRFRLEDDGKAYIDCTDEGIEFSEAYGNGEVCEVEQPCKEYEFLDPYQQQCHKKHFCDIPPMLVQVTRFRCGGVVLCLTASHKIFDGHSFSLFFRKWSSLALGTEEQSEPATFEYPRLVNTTVAIGNGMKMYDFPMDSEQQGPGPNIACKLFSFSQVDIELLKSRTLETSFRSLAVHVWSCITKARRLPIRSETKLAFTVNARKRFSPAIPNAVVGNVISFGLASCPVEELLNGQPATVARLITDAILWVNK